MQIFVTPRRRCTRDNVPTEQIAMAFAALDLSVTEEGGVVIETPIGSNELVHDHTVTVFKERGAENLARLQVKGLKDLPVTCDRCRPVGAGIHAGGSWRTTNIREQTSADVDHPSECVQLLPNQRLTAYTGRVRGPRPCLSRDHA